MKEPTVGFRWGVIVERVCKYFVGKSLQLIQMTAALLGCILPFGQSKW